MDTLQPYLNLLFLLTVLSVIAERATNLFKLRIPEMRVPSGDAEREKARERSVTTLAIGIGVLVAVLAKANMFEMLAHLEAPWDTLGWVQIDRYGGSRSQATSTVGNFLYALAGSVITGFALSFGSKFWHDTLDLVLVLRGVRKTQPRSGSGPASGADSEEANRPRDESSEADDA